MVEKSSISVQDLEKIDRKIDRLIAIVATQEDIGKVEARLGDVDARIERLVTGIDGFVKTHEDLRLE